MAAIQKIVNLSRVIKWLNLTAKFKKIGWGMGVGVGGWSAIPYHARLVVNANKNVLACLSEYFNEPNFCIFQPAKQCCASHLMLKILFLTLLPLFCKSCFILLKRENASSYPTRGCWKEVGSRAELRGTCIWRVSLFCWLVTKRANYWNG